MINLILLIVLNFFILNFSTIEESHENSIKQNASTDPDSEEFINKLLKAKDDLYSDSFFIEKLKQFQVEQNLYNKEKFTALLKFTEEKVLPLKKEFYSEAITKKIQYDLPNDIFQIANNYLYAKQINLEKSLENTIFKNLDKDDIDTQNYIIYDAIKL
jgi:hypothetical protein